MTPTDNAPIAPDSEGQHAARAPRTKGRTTPVAVRFDEFTLQRLKDLAAARNTGYQTLLKQFVQERLYEEEKRERIVE